MFKAFFLDKKWFVWSILGSILILLVTWYKVSIDVKLNEWYGGFYDLIQEALTHPNTISFDTFFHQSLTFLKIASVYVILAVLLEFFTRHFIFRWRTAMNDYYTQNWDKLRHIEGASQRIQEDTMRFAGIMESLGVSFIRSIMTLFAFLPLLLELSKHVTEYPWVGHIDYGLVYLVLLSSIGGTLLLAAVGIKLPSLEFNNQMVEAAYRKELVYGEDYADRAEPESVKELFDNVRTNYFRLYWHYLYFDLAKWSYLQVNVIVPLVALGPTIVAGAITLGIFQQISNAFSKVENSFQFLIQSWGTIVTLLSIYKRLRAFEKHINA